MTEQKSQAEKLEIILKVRGREITAKRAAALLGISRKTYYKWENRALAGMAESLRERPNGRPPGPPEDPEKEALRKEVAALKRENMFLQKHLELKDMVHGMTTGSQSSKKK